MKFVGQKYVLDKVRTVKVGRYGQSTQRVKEGIAKVRMPNAPKQMFNVRMEKVHHRTKLCSDKVCTFLAYILYPFLNSFVLLQTNSSVRAFAYVLLTCILYPYVYLLTSICERTFVLRSLAVHNSVR